MKMPPKSPDFDTAKDKLHAHYAVMERQLTREVDELANSGFASRHWASIARQHFEEGILAMHRALRDFPGDDPNEYGKTPEVRPYPFADPPTDRRTGASGADDEALPNYSEARKQLK